MQVGGSLLLPIMHISTTLFISTGIRLEFMAKIITIKQMQMVMNV